MIESSIVGINDIRPNSWNPNVLKGTIYEFLKKSIKNLGFIQPIIVTKNGTIIDGEHRWRALKELGYTQVEVKVLDLTDTEAKFQTLNLNLIKGTADGEKLGKLLLDLERSVGGDTLTECIAMERKQIERVIRQHQQAQEIKDVFVSPTSTNIQDGDVYALGNHTLKCGDSLKGDFVGGELVITDPPYNVGYKYGKYEDNLDESAYKEFIYRYVTMCCSLAPFVIITPGKVNERYYYSMFNIVDTACWFKGFSLTNGIVSNVMVTEPILFLGKKPLNKFLSTDHLAYNTDREEGLLQEHSCPKPLGLWKTLITTFSDIGDTVYDPFGGSGTTLIACELTDRIAYIQEIDPLYCESICQRWEKLTGRKREYET